MDIDISDVISNLIVTNSAIAVGGGFLRAFPEIYSIDIAEHLEKHSIDKSVLDGIKRQNIRVIKNDSFFSLGVLAAHSVSKSRLYDFFTKKDTLSEKFHNAFHMYLGPAVSSIPEIKRILEKGAAPTCYFPFNSIEPAYLIFNKGYERFSKTPERNARIFFTFLTAHELKHTDHNRFDDKEELEREVECDIHGVQSVETLFPKDNYADKVILQRSLDTFPNLFTFLANGKLPITNKIFSKGDQKAEKYSNFRIDLSHATALSIYTYRTKGFFPNVEEVKKAYLEVRESMINHMEMYKITPIKALKSTLKENKYTSSDAHTAADLLYTASNYYLNLEI